MKTLLLCIILLSGNIAFAQYFELTPNGLRSKKSPDKDYITVNYPGKLAADLYKKSKDLLADRYQDPKKAITTDQANKMLIWETYIPDHSHVVQNGKVEYISIRYNTVMYFSEGKINFSIKDIEMLNQTDEAKNKSQKAELYPELLNIEIKNSLEYYFDHHINGINNYISALTNKACSQVKKFADDDNSNLYEYYTDNLLPISFTKKKGLLYLTLKSYSSKNIPEAKGFYITFADGSKMFRMDEKIEYTLQRNGRYKTTATIKILPMDLNNFQLKRIKSFQLVNSDLITISDSQKYIDLLTCIVEK